MSVLGQKATLQGDRRMSALPQKLDIAEAREHARKGPEADIRAPARLSPLQIFSARALPCIAWGWPPTAKFMIAARLFPMATLIVSAYGKGEFANCAKTR